MLQRIDGEPDQSLSLSGFCTLFHTRTALCKPSVINESFTNKIFTPVAILCNLVEESQPPIFLCQTVNKRAIK